MTHLAQVAAFAGTQVVVEKAGAGAHDRAGRAERTVAPRRRVDGDARVRELSRMLAGVGDSTHARRHAAELLETAGAAPAGTAGPAESALMARLLRRKAARRPSPSRAWPRVDRRTKDLDPAACAGEIAVIDHHDLDRVAADGLIEAGVVAVVNAAQSISGRYPNGGPIRVVEAGHPAARRASAPESWTGSATATTLRDRRR